MCYIIKDISVSIKWTKPWDKNRGRARPFGKSNWTENYVPPEKVNVKANVLNHLKHASALQRDAIGKKCKARQQTSQ